MMSKYHMSIELQLFSLLIAALVVYGIVLAIKFLIDDLRSHQDLQEFTAQMYLVHDSDPDVELISQRFNRVESAISGQLISPEGLRWLERKVLG